MDISIDLSKGYISGKEELYQNIALVLKEPIGRFLQSPNMGATFSIHQAEESDLRDAVAKTIAQIDFVSVENVVVNLPNILVDISFKGDVFQYKYTVENGTEIRN